MKMDEMTITPSAQDYLFDLLSNQEEDTSGIKIFVSEPGTPRAETCIAYSKKDEDFSSFRLILHAVLLYFSAY